MFFLFAVAGNETLRNGIPGGLLTLLSHPAELARLRSDPSLLPSAVEEMLRYWPPVMDFRRTATQPVELSGQKINAGDKVVVYHASANRDETVFPSPDRFDITRTPTTTSASASAPTSAWAPTWPAPRCAPSSANSSPRHHPHRHPVRLASNFQNGLKHLPVHLTPRPNPVANPSPISVPLRDGSLAQLAELRTFNP